MNRIDLHIHTTASDSTVGPEDAVRAACEKGLTAIAITDHDNVRGYEAAAAEGEKLGLEVVRGIEISTKYGVAVHILGYYFDPESPQVREILDFVVKDREERNRKMAELMANDGLPVTFEYMKERFGEVVGRPHFARVLYELGLADSINDAFGKYVEKGRKYYLPRNILPIETAVSLVAEAGGVPVLAHPFQYHKNDGELRELIEHCMDYGLQGIECIYTHYDPEQIDYLKGLAHEYDLVTTGGSDYHGANKPNNFIGVTPNGSPVPEDFLYALKERAHVI